MEGYTGYDQVKMAIGDIEKKYFHYPIGKLLLHYDAV